MWEFLFDKNLEIYGQLAQQLHQPPKQLKNNNVNSSTYMLETPLTTYKSAKSDLLNQHVNFLYEMARLSICILVVRLKQLQHHHTLLRCLSPV